MMMMMMMAVVVVVAEKTEWVQPSKPPPKYLNINIFILNTRTEVYILVSCAWLYMYKILRPRVGCWSSILSSSKGDMRYCMGFCLPT